MTLWMLRMSLLGPTSMEVPVSRMAWQPPSHATTTPSTVTLQRADRVTPPCVPSGPPFLGPLWPLLPGPSGWESGQPPGPVRLGPFLESP